MVLFYFILRKPYQVRFFYFSLQMYIQRHDKLKINLIKFVFVLQPMEQLFSAF